MKNQLQVSLFPYETNSQIESKVSDKIKPPKNSLILPSFLPSKRYQNRTITQLSKFTTVPKFEQNRTKPRYPPQKKSQIILLKFKQRRRKREIIVQKSGAFLSLSLSRKTSERRKTVFASSIFEEECWSPAPAIPDLPPRAAIPATKFYRFSIPLLVSLPRIRRALSLSPRLVGARVFPLLWKACSSSNFPGGSTGKSSTIHASHGRLTFL